MSGFDRIASLIPWYAAGTLGADESAAVEAHLAGCDHCRALLALARGFRRLAPATDDAALYDHIQAQRLAEFAEDPALLEPDARRSITSHVRDCPPCAEALEILEDLGRAPAAGGAAGMPQPSGGLIDRARAAWDDLWRRMSRTVLRPGPAFAYLAALLVLVVALPLRTPAPGAGGDAPGAGPGVGGPGASPGPTPAPAPGPGPGPVADPQPAPLRPAVRTLAQPIPLSEEALLRDGAPAPPPVPVTLPADDALVPLELRTSVEREDLEDPNTRFRVTIVQEGDVLFEQVLAGTQFDRRSRLTLLLDPAAVRLGVPCRVTVVRVRPGDPADGEELYRRSFLPHRPK